MPSPPSGVPTGGSSKRLFFVPSTRNRPIVGEPYGRIGGEALLWERSERAQQVAKPEPVTERLAGYAAPSEYEGTPGYPLGGLGLPTIRVRV